MDETQARSALVVSRCRPCRKETSMQQMLSLRYPRQMVSGVVALILALTISSSVSAHEHREIGDYSLEVGFREEPALAGFENGLFLGVTRHVEDTTPPATATSETEAEEGPPVEGLEATLRAEISYGSATKELEIRPVVGSPGVYTADVIPMETGAYTFRIFGTIEGTAIDESFTGGPETFAEVVSTDSIAFPSSGDTVESGASDVQDTADSARTLAIVGIVTSVLGLAVGAAGLFIATRVRSASHQSATPDTSV